MREVVLDALFDCTPRRYFECLYATPDAFQQYHARANNDPHATVTAWEGDTRSVSFTVGMALPEAMKRFVGDAPIRMTEMQVVEWDADDQAGFSITSEPKMDLALASSFTTRIRTRVEGLAGQRGCKVTQTVAFTCHMSWPLSTTIEAIMVEMGQAQVAEFLAFCKEHCAQHLPPAGGAPTELKAPGDSAASAAAVEVAADSSGRSGAAAAAVAADAGSGEEDDAFYDAADSGSPSSSRAASPARAPRGTQPPDPLLAALQRLVDTHEQTNRLLEGLTRTVDRSHSWLPTLLLVGTVAAATSSGITFAIMRAPSLGFRA